ncbi:MAG: 4Fe-4S binding protein [Verrucomicrobia bacterium]|nr:4Fe-4S binding protein [Verrucomicrobiota bacterium]
MSKSSAKSHTESLSPWGPRDVARVDAIIAQHGGEPRHLIPILLGIQSAFNYLPEVALERVCARTDITHAQLYGVATFYEQFRLQPAGAHRIKVCTGTACHVKGAEAVFKAFCKQLNIAEGQDTDIERLFTVEKVACLGCCMLAPAVQIDQTTYGHLTPESVPSVLQDFLAAMHRRGASGTGSAGQKGESQAEFRLCRCTSCLAAGADALWEAAGETITRYGLAVEQRSVGCTGISFDAPLVELMMPDGQTFCYGKVAPQDVDAILLQHFQPARASQRVTQTAIALLDSLIGDLSEATPTRYPANVRDCQEGPYWQRQRHVALEHAGKLDPLDLDTYLAHDGFAALRKCRKEATPDAVIDTICSSGLRGRGGGGYLTGDKWRTVCSALGRKRYVVCNGDEGDPGSFMDRMLLESFPFRVIEGMAIAAHAIGATEGYLYIRGEYPLAVARMRQAIDICETHGLLTSSVPSQDACPSPPPSDPMPLSLHVEAGAGAFVCGEETALLAAIEGHRGTPRIRPPYPSEHGLYGEPTLINNVETFAAVPWIMRHGASHFRTLGTHGSPGTKAFALAGRIERGGLIEIPMGSTIREIVMDIGGGIQGGKAFKAVQIGGPSGGCIPAHLADTPIDFDALQEVGAIMGSGGLVVLDDTDCMVDIARYFLSFTREESCGKCTFCRIGTKRMLEILEALCEGTGSTEDLIDLERLCKQVQAGSLCGLGRTAPNPVLSTLQHFREEYEAHVEGRCPAKRCKALIRYVITEDCIGCTRCAQRCPVDAIAFTPHRQHHVDAKTCIRCDTCRQVCPSGAVSIMDQ